MKKTAILATVLFLSLALIHPDLLAAQNARMLDTRGPSLKWAYLDRILQGENLPTTIQSLSIREARFYGIDTGTTDNPDTSTLQGPFVRAHFIVQPFVLGWKGLDLSRNLTDSSLLERLRLDDPVLLAGVSFGSDSFYGTTSIDFGTDSLARYAGEDGITGIWQPLDFLSYWTFPEEGYLAWSDHNITLAAGRFATGIGLGGTNIFLNGCARAYDQLQFSWWSEKFKFFSLWGTSSTHLSDQEYEVQKYMDPDANDDSWGWDTLTNHDASTQSVVPLKMFTYHRFEFKPLSRAGFGIAEMQLVGGKVPDITNLVPTVTWHNTYTAGVSNVMVLADTWCVPVNGLLVWGEFVMDDSRAPKESGATKPNCWAWELGTKVAIPSGAAAWRSAVALEYSHADKWTYARWQPYLTMYQRQLLTGGHRGYDTPLGHPEGGDVDEIDLTYTALTRDGKKIELGYSWICKGPVYLGMIEPNSGTKVSAKYIPVYYDYDDYAGSGALEKLLGTTRKHTHVFSVKATWPLSRSWDVDGGIDFRYILNAGHVAGKTATETVYSAGFKWSFGKENR